MLGQFLEVGVATSDPRESWERLAGLGFTPAQAGDVWTYPYGVMTCDGLALGLHADPAAELTLFFVRPNVAELHRALADCGLEPEHAVLSHDAFNQLRLRDPAGIALRVLEARSFSPASQTPSVPVPGRFLHLAVPVRDTADVARFWDELGIGTDALEGPWSGVSPRGMPVVYHDGRQTGANRRSGPMLVFQSPDIVATATAFAGQGLALEVNPLPGIESEHLLLHLPDAPALLVLA